jgi:hypothetical protein
MSQLNLQHYPINRIAPSRFTGHFALSPYTDHVASDNMVAGGRIKRIQVQPIERGQYGNSIVRPSRCRIVSRALSDHSTSLGIWQHRGNLMPCQVIVSAIARVRAHTTGLCTRYNVL